MDNDDLGFDGESTKKVSIFKTLIFFQNRRADVKLSKILY